jgi:quercetin dioxygenase-like cupin family protein
VSVAEPLVFDADDLATETRTQLFLGRDHGVDASFFITDMAPGAGPKPHRHPYPEVFILREGEASFTIDGGEYAGRPGQVLVVPAGAVHSFVNSGSGQLVMVNIHPAAEMTTEWIG